MGVALLSIRHQGRKCSLRLVESHLPEFVPLTKGCEKKGGGRAGKPALPRRGEIYSLRV